MISRSYQQFAIVAGDSAQTLTDRLNEKLFELRDKNPTVTFEGMIARIMYEEREADPESLEEEYELQGVRISCQDCPFFSPILKADGTVDGRIKYGDCPFTEFGRTPRDGRACEQLFQMINSGEVQLCVSTK